MVRDVALMILGGAILAGIGACIYLMIDINNRLGALDAAISEPREGASSVGKAPQRPGKDDEGIVHGRQ